MFTQSFKKLGILVLVGLMMAGFIWVPSVAAAPLGDDPQPPLERLYAREQALLPKQQQRLEQTATQAQRAADFIAEQQTKGRDTGSLEAALADFNDSRAEAQKFYDQATEILGTHAGFDNAGKLTDKAQAAETVREAGRAQRQFHLTLTQAATRLRAAVRDYVREHRPKGRAAQP